MHGRASLAKAAKSLTLATSSQITILINNAQLELAWLFTQVLNTTAGQLIQNAPNSGFFGLGLLKKPDPSRGGRQRGMELVPMF